MKKFFEIACYTALAFTAFGLGACSSDDKDKHTGGATEETQIAIEDKTIAGVSEKGPFVKGSAVRLYELNADNLGQTGRAFTGKIASDRGDFRFTHLNLESQYVLLEANGFYRNEVSGTSSAASISLNALVDVSDRETANINLLTHLAYERMQHLVDDGSSVAEAKKQAEQEILKAFRVADESIEGFEGLSIFESGKGNAVLLAISILMQGELSEAEFSERLADFAYDIENDGVWDDSVTATKIADWASARSEGDYYASIRKNMEDWELSDTIPEFEKSVDKFWWENYGLGDCDKKAEGELRENMNKASEKYEKDYWCKEGRWLEDKYNDWEVYDDFEASTISIKRMDDTISVEYAIGHDAYGIGYSGINHSINASDEPEDYSGCEILEYSFKGRKHKFVLLTPLLNDDYWDWDYYEATVPGSSKWTKQYIFWDQFEHDCRRDCRNVSLEEARANVERFGWHLTASFATLSGSSELFATLSGTFELTGFGCVSRKDFTKTEKLEEPCEAGILQVGAASKRVFFCSENKRWINASEFDPDLESCEEESEGKVSLTEEGNPRYACTAGYWLPCADATDARIVGNYTCMKNYGWLENDCEKAMQDNPSLEKNVSLCCADSGWYYAPFDEK